MVVGGPELGGGNHADHAVEASVVEPVDILEGLELDVVKAAPGSALVDRLGLVEAVEGFG